MTDFFALIQVILKAFQLWDAFLDWMAEHHSKEVEQRRQARDKAIEDAKKAEGDDEIWDSQGRIVDSEPKP